MEKAPIRGSNSASPLRVRPSDDSTSDTDVAERANERKGPAWSSTNRGSDSIVSDDKLRVHLSATATTTEGPTLRRLLRVRVRFILHWVAVGRRPRSNQRPSYCRDRRRRRPCNSASAVRARTPSTAERPSLPAYYHAATQTVALTASLSAPSDTPLHPLYSQIPAVSSRTRSPRLARFQSRSHPARRYDERQPLEHQSGLPRPMRAPPVECTASRISHGCGRCTSGLPAV